MSRPTPPKTTSRKQPPALQGQPKSKPVKAPSAPPGRRGPDLRLLVILLLSAVLGLGFARSTPKGANPDEGAHLEFVRIVATEFRLPALNVEERKQKKFADANYEAHQAPLYYLLAAPFYRVGEAVDATNGPTQGARLLSILIGLAGTTFIWLLAREMAPGRPGIWVAATAIAAFLPMRLSVAASVGNDILAEALGTWALLLMVRGVRGSWSRSNWVWLGVALGLALLAKQNSILLLPIAFFAVLFAAKRTEPDPSATGMAADLNQPLFFRSGLTILGVAVLISGWWFVRNQVLYHDPLALQVFNEYFLDAPRFEAFKAGGYTYQSYLETKVFPTAFASFWGWFGYLLPKQANLALGAYGSGPPERWGYPPKSWLYPILGQLLLVAALGVLVYAIRKRLRPIKAEVATGNPGARVGVGLLIAHAAFVFGAFLNFNTTYFQAQGRYLLPAIATIALGMAGGWLEWVRTPALLSTGDDHERGIARTQVWETVAGWAIAAAMLVLALYAYFGVLVPGFSHS